jgi:hypothetical protein
MSVAPSPCDDQAGEALRICEELGAWPVVHDTAAVQSLGG